MDADSAELGGPPDEHGDTATYDGTMGADSAKFDGRSDGGPDTGATFVAAIPCLRPDDYVTTPLFVATVGVAYKPACLRVPVGTVVTIESSTEHPLEPRAVSSSPNPIPFQTSTTPVKFATPGFYGFRCPEHSDQQMLGVIWIAP